MLAQASTVYPSLIAIIHANTHMKQALPTPLLRYRQLHSRPPPLTTSTTSVSQQAISTQPPSSDTLASRIYRRSFATLSSLHRSSVHSPCRSSSSDSDGSASKSRTASRSRAGGGRCRSRSPKAPVLHGHGPRFHLRVLWPYLGSPRSRQIPSCESSRVVFPHVLTTLLALTLVTAPHAPISAPSFSGCLNTFKSWARS